MKTQFRYLVAVAISAVCGCATVSDLQAKTPEDAIDAFMREYIGVQFGDDISKINGYEDASYEIPMLKDFRYFNRVSGFYQKGKLSRVNMWVDVDKKYSQTSTDVKLKKTLEDLSEAFGLQRDYFDCKSAYYACPQWGDPVTCVKVIDKPCKGVELSYKVFFDYVELPNYRRYLIDIVDRTLDASLKSNKVQSPNYPPVTDAMRRNWGLPLPDAE